jgi:hypothetical protein
VQSFGENGVALSACTDNLGPAFDRLATIMNVED